VVNVTRYHQLRRIITKIIDIGAGILWCALFAAGPAHGETKIQALAKEIEADAERENPRMGLDTLIRGAERLRDVDPATARQLLDKGAAWLNQFPRPSYFTLRFMDTYAHIDLDVAEKVGATIPDKAWVYAALIEQSARVKDYVRATRLVRQAGKDGQYSLSAVTFAMQQMVSDAPESAAELLVERVADFPEHAKASDVFTLLRSLAVFQWPDLDLTRGALRKIFAALDRPGFKENTGDFEETAIYEFHGIEIKTGTTFETVLLPAAAYLALWDSEAFRARAAALPSWGPALADLRMEDLPRLARAQITRVQKPGPPRPKSAPLPDISKMSYPEAMSMAKALEFPANYSVLTSMAVRKDFTGEQRKAVFEEIFPLLRRDDAFSRYNGTRWMFWEAEDSKIEGLFAEAALEWIGALDAAVSSNDSMLLQEQGRGMIDVELRRLDELFHQRDFALSTPHPSIVSRRALARLDGAANQIADFSLFSLDGTAFHLRELKGKIVLIDFWATWCPPCRDEVPALQKIHEESKSKGVVVLGVDDEPAGVIRAFNTKNGVTYPTLLDPDRKVHELFGVDGIGQGIPLAVVFDRDGKFVGRVPFPHTEEGFLQLLKKAGL
jgi:peroxiredoxin